MLVPIYYLPYYVPCDSSTLAPTNWIEWLLYIILIVGFLITFSVIIYDFVISPIIENILDWWDERRRKK